MFILNKKFKNNSSQILNLLEATTGFAPCAARTVNSPFKGCLFGGRPAELRKTSFACLPSNPVAPNQEINPKGTEVPFGFMVEATGFEPTTLWSRTIRATNCATPQYGYIIYSKNFSVK